MYEVLLLIKLFLGHISSRTILYCYSLGSLNVDHLFMQHLCMSQHPIHNFFTHKQRTLVATFFHVVLYQYNNGHCFHVTENFHSCYVKCYKPLSLSLMICYQDNRYICQKATPQLSPDHFDLLHDNRGNDCMSLK